MAQAKKKDEVDEAFMEFEDMEPSKRKKLGIVPKKTQIEVKKQYELTTLTSWGLLREQIRLGRELHKRHSYFVYAVGFWVELVIILWIKQGK